MRRQSTAADSVANIEKMFQQDGVREKLDDYVLTKLPVETRINSKGESDSAAEP